MGMGYMEVCQPLPWCQCFDPSPYAWTWSGWWRYGSPSDETKPTSLRSGKTEPATLGEMKTTSSGSGEMELAPKGSGEAEPVVLGSSEAEHKPKGPGEMEAAHLGAGWSRSHALDCSDELMLITISPSSLGTLVLVPDRLL